MVALQAGTAIGGAATGFVQRHRIAVFSVVLSLVGIATGTTTATAVLQGVSLLEPLIMAAGVVLAIVCCAVQTRHFGLAVTAALAPVPGLLWVAPLSAGSNYGIIPFLAYATGLMVSMLAAQTAVGQALETGRHEYPWRAAAAAFALTLVLAALWFWNAEPRQAVVQAVADLGAAMISALILVPLGAAVLHFDENFVTRANRLREERQRMLQRLALVAGRRWGLSFAGIAMVFIALGWFETVPVMRTGAGALGLRVASAVAVVAGAGLLVRDWREGMATALAAAAVCLVSLWAAFVAGYGPLAPVGVLEAVAASLLLALHGVRGTLLFRARGEPPAVARQRMIEEAGTGQVFAAAGAVLAMVPVAAVSPAHGALIVALLAAGVGGIVWAPASAAVLEIMFPQHRSVEHLYAPRKKPL